jgi:hypothetical protein
VRDSCNGGRRESIPRVLAGRRSPSSSPHDDRPSRRADNSCSRVGRRPSSFALGGADLVAGDDHSEYPLQAGDAIELITRDGDDVDVLACCDGAFPIP